MKILNTTAGASVVTKGRITRRSAWWKIGCGGLVFSFIFALDFCAV